MRAISEPKRCLAILYTHGRAVLTAEQELWRGTVLAGTRRERENYDATYHAAMLDAHRSRPRLGPARVVSVVLPPYPCPPRYNTSRKAAQNRTRICCVYNQNQPKYISPGNRKHKLYIIHTRTPPCLWSCYVSASTLLVCKFTRANLLTQCLSRETFESEAKNSPRFLQLEAIADLFKYIVLEHSVVLVGE